MKITSVDIRHQTFEKTFRGFNTEQVERYLADLAKEWERISNDNKMLRMQLEIAEKELHRLKDAEVNIPNVLQQAEESSNIIVEQGQSEAERSLQQARQKSEELVAQGRRQADMLLQDAENKVRFLREEAAAELKNFERDFKAMEKYRDSLIGQLRVLIGNVNETVERYEKKFPKEGIREKFDELMTLKGDEPKGVSKRSVRTAPKKGESDTKNNSFDEE